MTKSALFRIIKPDTNETRYRKFYKEGLLRASKYDLYVVSLNQKAIAFYFTADRMMEITACLTIGAMILHTVDVLYVCGVFYSIGLGRILLFE